MGGIKLSEMERLIVTGLMAREREIQREYLTPYQQDFAFFLRSVEERMGLEREAIGKTHQLDLSSFTIVEMPKLAGDKGTDSE